MKKLMKLTFLLAAVSLVMASCAKKSERSAATGWKYNDAKWGGFEKVEYKGQEAGPNLVFIQGGTFLMGQTEEDVMFDYQNIPRRITVSSFYIDETEVSNIDYRVYTEWLYNVFNESNPMVFRKALPDTLVWREELSYNEPFVETYFRFPAYYDYPVVGVNWVQANEFCKWRTDRVNEMILIEKGVIANDLQEGKQKGEQNFNTDAYLVGQYEATPNAKGKSKFKDLRTGQDRRVRNEDGVLLPAYRLPTEAEWEFAALGLIGNMAYAKDERITDRRLYPWDGNTMRYQVRGKYQGKMMANFKRDRGDYMGMAGNLNDNAHITAEVRSNYPNDYGLYNMAGNVNEWCLDVYRPMTSTAARDVENNDLNYFRGNVFQEKVLDAEGRPVPKDSLGRLRTRPVKDEDVASRNNYKRGDVINYLDGDEDSEVVYLYGKSSLINDSVRVIKGGSWADRAYWLAPGARRFLNQEQSSRTVGFRCAMTRLGSPGGNEFKGGNQFKTKSKIKKADRRYK